VVRALLLALQSGVCLRDPFLLLLTVQRIYECLLPILTSNAQSSAGPTVLPIVLGCVQILTLVHERCEPVRWPVLLTQVAARFYFELITSLENCAEREAALYLIQQHLKVTTAVSRQVRVMFQAAKEGYAERKRIRDEKRQNFEVDLAKKTGRAGRGEET